MCDQGGGKRERENDVENDEEERDTVGQVPAGATTSTKKRKTLAYEQVYLENLPSAEMYERSYMHRDVITHTVSTR
jgi:peptidylprolyl isomerase domain and WD repeat-containing protein 1